MIKRILFLTLLLNNISFAGTIVNSPPDQSSSAKIYGIGTSKAKSGNIYNDKVTINSSTKSESKTTNNNKNNNFNANIKTNVNGLQKILIDIF